MGSELNEGFLVQWRAQSLVYRTRQYSVNMYCRYKLPICTVDIFCPYNEAVITSSSEPNDRWIAVLPTNSAPH